jgi:hypothetical protein
MRPYFLIFLFLFTVATINLVSPDIQQVFAQQAQTQQTIVLRNPLGSTGTLSELLKNIIIWLATKFGPIAATLMIIIGALFILFAGDSEERFKTGKKIILYTAIGYGIILLADGIMLIIKKLLQ